MFDWQAVDWNLERWVLWANGRQAPSRQWTVLCAIWTLRLHSSPWLSHDLLTLFKHLLGQISRVELAIRPKDVSYDRTKQASHDLLMILRLEAVLESLAESLSLLLLSYEPITAHFFADKANQLLICLIIDLTCRRLPHYYNNKYLVILCLSEGYSRAAVFW